MEKNTQKSTFLLFVKEREQKKEEMRWNGETKDEKKREKKRER